MKKSYLIRILAIIIFMLSEFLYGQTTTIDFETADSGYTASTTFGSGTTNVFNRINTALGGNSTYYWAAEDISGDPSIVLNQIDITGASSFVFSIDMLIPNDNDWDYDDELLITYSVDGGTYQNLIWVQGNDLSNNQPAALDTNFDGLGDCGAGTTIPALVYDNAGCGDVGSVFSTFSTSAIALSSNSTLDIKLQFNGLDSNDEGIYLDNIVINTSAASPTISFDSSTSSLDETDATFATSGIPITLSNYDAANVEVTATVNGSSTAEAGDYTLDLTPLTFDTNETLNLPLSINPDADISDETIIIDITVTSGTADLNISQHIVTIIDDEVPRLIITEVADPVDSSGRFVEIYNTGNTSVNLNSFQVYFVKSVDNGISYSQTALSGTIEANGVFVIADFTNFLGAYDFAPETNYSEANGDGDDAYALYYGGDRSNGTLLDAYGVQGEDGSGEAWEYENSRAIRNNPKSASPNATWTSGEWTISSGDLSDMTPGALENEFRYVEEWKPRDISNASTSDNVLILEDDFSVSSDLNINNLEINSSSEVTVDANTNLDVNGDLTVEGSLIINAGASMIVDGSSSGSGSISYVRNLSGGQWYLMSSSVTGETYDDAWITANSIPSGSNNNRALSTYDNSVYDTDEDGDGPDTATGHWRYMQAGTSSSFETGRGYALKRSSTGDVTFTGTGIHTNDQTFELVQGEKNYNLVGNPFTAYLDLGDFYTTNSNVLNTTRQTFWFWNGSSYDARTANLFPDYKIAPGQGFFVEASVNNENLTFTAAQREHNTSDTFQRNPERPEINVFISDGNKRRYTNIYYVDGTTTGHDPGFDATQFGGSSQSLELYSHILSDNVGDKYQLQSLPNNDHSNMIIPLGVKAQSGSYTFTIDTFHLPVGYKVFLEDKINNSFIRLDEINTSYEVTFNEAIDGVGRFYLHTTTEALGTNDFNLNHISMYTTSPQNLRITGVQSGQAKVTMFNILGAKVMSSNFEGSGINDIPLPNLKKGIFVIQLVTETGKLTKKIIVN